MENYKNANKVSKLGGTEIEATVDTGKGIPRAERYPYLSKGKQV